jgi:hypothetical protein
VIEASLKLRLRRSDFVRTKEETVICATDEIASQAQPLPRDWARLIRKLRWIGLDDQAARLEWAVGKLPVEQRCEIILDPSDTD